MSRRALTAAFLLAVAGLASATASTVDFTLEGLDGRTHRLSDYRGRWVVVNFWATWCGPCLEEIPDLVEFHADQRDGNAMVIGVNFEKIETTTLAEFVRNHGIGYPIVRAGEQPIIPFEPLNGLPATFIVDPGGTLVACRLGPVTRAAIEHYLSGASATSSTQPATTGWSCKLAAVPPSDNTYGLVPNGEVILARAPRFNDGQRENLRFRHLSVQPRGTTPAGQQEHSVSLPQR